MVQALLSRGATVLAVDEEGGWGLGSGIHSSCEGELGIALESMQGKKDLI